MTTKLYPTTVLKTHDEKSTAILNNIIDKIEEMQDTLSEDKFQEWSLNLYNQLRKTSNFPDKVFALGRNNDHTKAIIFIFDIEPNETIYTVYQDENNNPYILIEKP